MDSSWGQLPPMAASRRAAFLAADFFIAVTPLTFLLRIARKFIFICYRIAEQLESGPRSDEFPSPLRLLDLLHQRRHHLEQIAADPVVRYFENRRLRVLVDRHDRFRALHPPQVLNPS